ncbi:protein MAINTENANCE OF MERISTEMS-like [Humulus lupulus]|uniref:protein MAINTENANCE OF MERISTEMS-like n=1 Tax=Humulus lupulus TaxID=3486 RepID=UPI002B417C50|nr:protein MAINTENANCE OF MERISTEMS-like [Humulus lupulus]
MTLTPIDFSAISGLPVYGKVLKMNKRVHRNPNLLRTLVGEPLALLKKSRVEVSWLYSVYKNMPLNTGTDCDKLARVFILALLGSTLFVRRNNMVDLYYIPSLQCIADIPNFNWGGAGLAFAYQQMDDLCKLNTHCIGGLWKTWEETNPTITSNFKTSLDNPLPQCGLEETNSKGVEVDNDEGESMSNNVRL